MPRFLGNLKNSFSLLLRGYGEVVNVQTLAASTLTIDYARGNNVSVLRNDGISTITFQNLPVSGVAASITLKMTSSGNFPVTWPAGTKWVGSSTPTLTTTNGFVDIVTIYTDNAGTTTLNASLLGFPS